MDKVSVLRSFEDDIGEMSQEGIETCLHIPDHLHLPRQLVPQKEFNRFVGSSRLLCQQLLVPGKYNPESIVRNL